MRQNKMSFKDLIFWLSVILCLASIVCIDVEGSALAYFTYYFSFIHILHYLMRYKGVEHEL